MTTVVSTQPRVSEEHIYSVAAWISNNFPTECQAYVVAKFCWKRGISPTRYRLVIGGIDPTEFKKIKEAYNRFKS